MSGFRSEGFLGITGVWDTKRKAMECLGAQQPCAARSRAHRPATGHRRGGGADVRRVWCLNVVVVLGTGSRVLVRRDA
ncbi:hypothetical protein OG346_04840 [Streptomyces sp. NBC_01530]